MTKVGPAPQGGCPYLASFTWTIPAGVQLYKINYTHKLLKDVYEMDIDGSQKVVITPRTIIFISEFTDCFKFFTGCFDSCFSRRALKSYDSKDFTFGAYQFTVCMVDDGKDMMYSLKINGKNFKDYHDSYYKRCSVWIVEIDGKSNRIVLDKTLLNVYVDGVMLDEGIMNFPKEGGPYCNFLLGTSTECHIETMPGDSGTELSYELTVNKEIIPLVIDVGQETYTHNM